jgi:RNA polymerase sigma-70 factor (ECF subfamily)
MSLGERELAQLMRAAQQGDQVAYQTALRACVGLVAATVRRSGVSGELVNDVVQDVLLTVHRALPTYDPARPFLPWLRAIAARRAIDALRSHGRRGAREVHDPEAYENHPEDRRDVSELEELAGESARLREAIATLPPRQRQAMEMIGLQEYSLDQAAAETGASKVALKVNFFRAIQSLRARLKGGGDV